MRANLFRTAESERLHAAFGANRSGVGALVLPLRQRLITQYDHSWAHVRIGSEARSDLAIDSMWKQVVKLYETGLHPAIALCIRHRGQVVMDRTVGHVENHPDTHSVGEHATPQTLFSLFSASKIVRPWSSTAWSKMASYPWTTAPPTTCLNSVHTAKRIFGCATC